MTFQEWAPGPGCSWRQGLFDEVWAGVATAFN